MRIGENDKKSKKQFSFSALSYLLFCTDELE